MVESHIVLRLGLKVVTVNSSHRPRLLQSKATQLQLPAFVILLLRGIEMRLWASEAPFPLQLVLDTFMAS